MSDLLKALEYLQNDIRLTPLMVPELAEDANVAVDLLTAVEKCGAWRVFEGGPKVRRAETYFVDI